MLSGGNDKFINVNCLRSLLGYSRRGVQTHPLLPASHWQPNHTAILSPQDMPAFIKTPQTDMNSDPVTPPSGRHVSTPYLSLLKSVFSITQLAITHTFTLIHKITHRTHCACWLTGTTDCSTSQTPFQTRDNWMTADWGLVAGREHMLYLPTSRGLPSTLWMWYGQLWSLFEWI